MTENKRELSVDDVKTRGLEVIWRGQSMSMPQNPVNHAGKAQFVGKCRRWRRHMENIGLRYSADRGIAFQQKTSLEAYSTQT